MVTPEQRARHIANGGENCPRCNEPNPIGGSINFDFGEVSQQMDCSACGLRYWDVYKLTEIQVSGEVEE